MTDDVNVDYPERCPHCGASLLGTPIPRECRSSYDGRTHFSRLDVSIEHGTVVELRCPDCKGVLTEYCGRRLPCRHCNEPILANEWRYDGWHHECFIRVTHGSIGHQQGRCSCFGGTDEDPPGMTIRQAAKAAFDWAFNTYRASKN